MDSTDVALFPLLLIGIIFFNRYFFGLFLKKVTARVNPPNFGFEPHVTIILPLFNEGSSIYTTLMSLADLEYPKDKLRILVADDCSTDDSFTWVEKAMAESSLISAIRCPTNMGKRLAISRVVQTVASEFVVSVDSDVVVRPDALRHLLSGFTSPNIAAVGGRVHVYNSQFNWLTKMQTIKYFIGYQYLKNLENSFLSVMCLSGCLTAYRRSVLIELEPILMERSLFDVPIKYGEDRFLTRQILKHGYQTRLILEAQCFTKAPTTLSNYFSQQLRWRRSNIVDFIGGITHVWRLNFFVAVHYFAMQCIILAYPVYLWGVFIHGSLFESMAIHSGVLAVYGLIYHVQSRGMASEYRVHPIYALALGIMLPLTYMVISILALLTLDAGSWETRVSTVKKVPAAAV